MFVPDAARVARVIPWNCSHLAGYEILIGRLRIPRIHGSIMSEILHFMWTRNNSTLGRSVAVLRFSSRHLSVGFRMHLLISPFYRTKKVHIFERWREVLILTLVNWQKSARSCWPRGKSEWLVFLSRIFIEPRKQTWRNLCCFFILHRSVYICLYLYHTCTWYL